MPLAQHQRPLRNIKDTIISVPEVSEVPLCEGKNDHLSPFMVYHRNRLAGERRLGEMSQEYRKVFPHFRVY